MGSLLQYNSSNGTGVQVVTVEVGNIYTEDSIITQLINELDHLAAQNNTVITIFAAVGDIIPAIAKAIHQDTNFEALGIVTTELVSSGVDHHLLVPPRGKKIMSSIHSIGYSSYTHALLFIPGSCYERFRGADSAFLVHGNNNDGMATKLATSKSINEVPLTYKIITTTTEDISWDLFHKIPMNTENHTSFHVVLDTEPYGNILDVDVTSTSTSAIQIINEITGDIQTVSPQSQIISPQSQTIQFVNGHSYRLNKQNQMVTDLLSITSDINFINKMEAETIELIYSNTNTNTNNELSLI